MGTGIRHRLGILIPLLIVIGVALFPSSQVAAQDETITIDSLTLPEDGQGSVELKALNMPAPGLGAWLIDIVYDPAVVSATSCDSVQPFSVCNAQFLEDTVRLAGVDENGLQGDVALAIISFTCQAVGTTALTINAHRLADTASVDIAATVEDGSITCGEPAAAGDANCSGAVDSIDAALILQFSADIVDTLACQGAADVNGNGTVNSVDAALVLQFVAGLLDSL